MNSPSVDPSSHCDSPLICNDINITVFLFCILLIGHNSQKVSHFMLHEIIGDPRIQATSVPSAAHPASNLLFLLLYLPLALFFFATKHLQRVTCTGEPLLPTSLQSPGCSYCSHHPVRPSIPPALVLLLCDQSPVFDTVNPTLSWFPFHPVDAWEAVQLSLLAPLPPPAPDILHLTFPSQAPSLFIPPTKSHLHSCLQHHFQVCIISLDLFLEFQIHSLNCLLYRSSDWPWGCPECQTQMPTFLPLPSLPSPFSNLCSPPYPSEPNRNFAFLVKSPPPLLLSLPLASTPLNCGSFFF